jgi:hypothetical protein
VNSRKKFGMVGAAGISIAAVAALLPSSASAAPDNPFTGGVVPAANPRVGIQDNTLISSLDETSVAWGHLPLTNPDTDKGITHYGYNTRNSKVLTQNETEAFKTEPDKNVYLTFNGRHYVYQGHELGPQGYVTRVDLDETDPAKKVTLIADTGTGGDAAPPTFDGITWNPFTHQLLLTSEAQAPKGGVFGLTLNADGNPTDGILNRLPAMGSGGYEGVQNDSDGNVWIVEDVGGAAAGTNNKGKVPNSYVYRFTPRDKADLTKGGTLEALQVLRPDGTPATFDQLKTDGRDAFIGQLHTFGTSFATRWVTVDPANSTAGAAAAGATPFKRPENGVFRPGTGFKEFYFTETGDTNADSDLPGAFGGVFRLAQSGPSAATGRLSLSVLGDKEHTGFDNIQFATKDQMLVVEDAGDGLHAQRNALDSGYVANLNDKGESRNLVRWLAEGRDSSATYDAVIPHATKNDGDNEITGVHVSDGDPSVGGILGAKVPTPFANGWRAFWSQQHGDNALWELRPTAGNGRSSGEGNGNHEGNGNN